MHASCQPLRFYQREGDREMIEGQNWKSGQRHKLVVSEEKEVARRTIVNIIASLSTNRTVFVRLFAHARRMATSKWWTALPSRRAKLLKLPRANRTLVSRIKKGQGTENGEGGGGNVNIIITVRLTTTVLTRTTETVCAWFSLLQRSDLLFTRERE